MALTCTVGGARGMFEGGVATEVVVTLDRTFGFEGDWEIAESHRYGALAGDGWSVLRERAVADLSAEELPNLLALKDIGRAVYLPTHVQAISLQLSAGSPLRCASLPGLCRELAALADRWEVPQDDDSLEAILRGTDEGSTPDAPEILAFARLTLATYEAMRRDCPLWLFDEMV
jgi:hypothetical protein